MRRRPTVEDIASAAGVSVATVDRVINNRLPVKKQTAERVLAAAEQIARETGTVIAAPRRLSDNMPTPGDPLLLDVLDAACENGDLTRQGVLDAFNELEEVDTGGLTVPIRGFELGKSPSLESFILRPADVPGGAEVVGEAFEGEFAEQIAG